MAPTVRGRFVTFEGNEGGGKSTQIQLLSRRLVASGHQVRVLREPGGTSIGEEIRHLLKHSPSNVRMCAITELLMMNASRAQLVQEIIEPALERGEIVLCDRFFDSTLVYQGYGRGLDLDVIRDLTRMVVGTTQPDLTFLLQVPIEVSEARQRQRAREQVPVRDRFEEAGREFFRRVDTGYAALAKAEPARIRVVDATAPIETVARFIESLWVERFGGLAS